MPIDFSRLLPLGWSNFFSTQVPLEALDHVRPARVVRVERERYGVDVRNLLGRAPGRVHRNRGLVQNGIATKLKQACPLIYVTAVS